MRKNRSRLLTVIILILFVLSYTGSGVASVFAEPADDSVTGESAVTSEAAVIDEQSAANESYAAEDNPADGITSVDGTPATDGTTLADGTALAAQNGNAPAAENSSAPAGNDLAQTGTASTDGNLPENSEASTEDADDMTVTYEAMNDEESAQIADTGIPAINLVIDPDEYQKMIDSEEHSYRAENCSLQITVPDNWESEYGPGDTSIFGRDLALDYIRGRGNSTWMADKKPFKLKLSKKTDLFGMGRNKHWVLLANSMDSTLLKNRRILVTSVVS